MCSIDISTMIWKKVSSLTTVSTTSAAFASESLWFTARIHTEKGVEDDDSIRTTINTSRSLGKKLTTTTMSPKKAYRQRYQKLYSNLKKYQTSKRRRRNIQENPLLEIPLEDIEGVYEVIDELNMINDLENVMEGSESETNEGYVKPDNNGYLTPYQPADEDSNTNNSYDNKLVSLQSSNANEYATSDRVSTTSSSDVQGRRCSYINTNQPTVHSADTQDYLSTHSSGSETISRESGCLNPYQPMIAARNLHEYKYVIGFSDGSGSSLSETFTKEIGANVSHPYQDLTSEIDIYDYQ
ncbi:unnamed protein product [Mytilus coruscus]|uniref:Uncharacterized protein n=1 Tax=Mytilus coruscus TaxID=42192 RepID=A0A6J8A3E6_MYTCO|nr:unnamed protein product [Mytilus coruscus]